MSKRPVKVSGAAHKVLADHFRTWSGWRDGSLVLGKPDPKVSPWAMTDFNTHQATVNVDELLLNPNRVLNTLTPFRLRQEAVLTGAILHEAAHARFSKWMPRNIEQVKATRHSDGTVPTPQTWALARLAEEARIEGLMAAYANATGTGLGWTMQAAAAHLMPTTALDTLNEAQQIMALIQSWILRAGRQVAVRHHVVGFPTRRWVSTFNATLNTALIQHTHNLYGNGYAGTQACNLLIQMVEWDGVDPNRTATAQKANALGFVDEDEVEIDNATSFEDHAGPYLLDLAREVLDRLFPAGSGVPQPMAMGACAGGHGEPGENGDESHAQGNGGESDQSDSTEPGDGESGGEEGQSGSGSVPQWAEELEDLEAQCQKAAKEAAKEEAKKEAERQQEGGSPGGVGSGGVARYGMRLPTPAERDIAKGAEKFLRDLINPSESSKTLLTESPSATVDPAALSAWRSGGMVKEPKFFRRVKRTVDVSPPVKIAILVDISGSMDQMQKPSAILSWALASAALDLRNFAGRGQQIESTLIHWGDDARVIYKNGEKVPGIQERPCNDGTTAMTEAMRLVEREIPDFYEVSAKPSNRLLIQFTDWELTYSARKRVIPEIVRAMEAGVNMLSIVPPRNSLSVLRSAMREAKVQRGLSRVVRYDGKPDHVWDEAARLLASR